jgi:hypothetical protein
MVPCLIADLLGDQFHFVSTHNPDDANDRKARRLARSHAVARGLEKKRKLQQESGHNFRALSLKDSPGQLMSKNKRSQTLVASQISLSADTLDPFQMLAIESPRLQALHSQRKIFATLRNTSTGLHGILQTRLNMLQSLSLTVQMSLCFRTFARFFEKGWMITLF